MTISIGKAGAARVLQVKGSTESIGYTAIWCRRLELVACKRAANDSTDAEMGSSSEFCRSNKAERNALPYLIETVEKVEVVVNSTRSGGEGCIDGNDHAAWSCKLT